MKSVIRLTALKEITELVFEEAVTACMTAVTACKEITELVWVFKEAV